MASRLGPLLAEVHGEFRVALRLPEEGQGEPHLQARGGSEGEGERSFARSEEGRSKGAGTANAQEHNMDEWVRMCREP